MFRQLAAPTGHILCCALLILTASCGQPDAIEKPDVQVDVSVDTGAALDTVALLDSSGTGLCKGPADCSGATPQCDTVTGACVPCLFDHQCDKDSVCLGKTCAAPVECKSDKACLDVDAVCDAASGHCVDCLADGDCGEGTVCRLAHCVPKPKACGSSKECLDVGGVCDKANGYCVDCTSDPDCAATDYCESGICLKDICAKGDSKCLTPAKLSTCLESGGGWTQSDCKTTEACDDGACKIVICKPGIKVCAQNVVKICNARGTGVGEGVVCKSTEVCKDGACLPKVCEPGETKCASGAVETCAEDGLTWLKTGCAATESCAVAAGQDGKPSVAACELWICTPKQDVCQGDKLAVCADNGLSKVAGKSCAKLNGGAAATCIAGVCVSKACKEGEKACAKQSTLTCKAGAWLPLDCPAKQTCTGGTCVPVSCVPKETYCDLTVLKTCNGAGDDATWVEDCAASGKGCKGGKCVALLCQPESTACDDKNNAAKTCKADGFGWVSIPCGTTHLCLGGACAKKICTPKASFCVGADVMKCHSTGTAQTKLKTCVKGTACVKGACLNMLCAPGTTQCGAGATVGKLETCAVDGLSWKPSGCGAGNICDAGACETVVCKPGIKGCVDDSIATCSALGTVWVKTTDCAAKKNVCIAGGCVSKACKAGEVKCSGDQIAVCNGTGTGWNKANCDDSDACTANFCKDGKCGFGASKVCDDKNPCTDDACNKGSGKCVAQANNAGCDDGTVCTTGDHCESGKCLPAASGLVGTLSGNGKNGVVDGTGASALHGYPRGMGHDSAGNLYVADYGGHRIRRITPTGNVTTVGGSGSAGFLNGSAKTARFYYPADVAAHTDGSLFVADRQNQRIRKISASGNVTTFAGSGSAGFKNGASTTARFYYPESVAVSAGGIVYVADSYNNRIRKISPNGMVTSFVGSGSSSYKEGTGTLASVYRPTGVAVNAVGTVYFSSSYHQMIRQATPSGVTSLLAGSLSGGFKDGVGSAARFYYPADVAVDSQGRVLVADRQNNRIRRIDPNGKVTTVAGTGSVGFTNGALNVARFNHPYGVTAFGDRIYVGDSQNFRVRVIKPATKTCSDGKPCTADSCDAKTGACTSTPIAAGKGCSDGDACTTGEVCTKAATCGGGKIKTCADGKACTYDICNTSDATCTNPQHDNACSDGNGCTQGDACKGGTCIGGLGFIETVAGSGTAGFADGKASEATFSSPRDSQSMSWVAPGLSTQAHIMFDGYGPTVWWRPWQGQACQDSSTAPALRPASMRREAS